MPNRLARSTSPYLLQHRDNPVDWWEWSPEALADAKRTGKPVLLSIGYAACHWCHVMAHESFENEHIATLMNDNFVNIKVDREERPDIDAVYMEAVQAMTGHGGWPLTAFLTPDGEPFFCGTYFPPTPRSGMPSFPQVLASVAQAWRERRGEVEEAGRQVVSQLSARTFGDAGMPLTEQLLDDAVTSLEGDFDRDRGGFGGAPKFPPSMVLEFLLRAHARSGRAAALDMVVRTCDAMARGGMYDQLGGGFARYSVDALWVVPHFEKMLYDNALLLRLYGSLWRATGSPLAERVVRETAEFLLRDLRTPEGGFASALDADSEGEEGKYYVWTPAQLIEALGNEDGRWAADVFAVGPLGTFEHGTSVLQLLADPEDAARLADVRERLRTAREQRVPPATDDKVVAAWNGLAIAGLAECGALFGQPHWISAASEAANLLAQLHVDGNRLRRTSRAGQPGANAGVLEDYADVSEGLLALFSVTGEPRWLELAGRLLDSVQEQFADPAGGFFDTAADAETLVRRPQDPTDNVVPAGASAAAGALLTYAAITGSGRSRDAAEAALRRAAPLVARFPRFAGWSAAVGEALIAGPQEIAVVGPAGPATAALERVARMSASPGAVVAVGEPGSTVPLLAGRRLIDDVPAAYVCRGFVCQRPVTDPDDLRQLLTERSA